MKALLLLGTIVLIGCAPQQVPPPALPSAELLAPYNVRGTADLKGSALLRQQGGGVVTCAGHRVMLMPDNSFSREVVNLLRQGKQITGAASVGQYSNAFRETICDAQGFFYFEGLAPGNWMVMTEVSWAVGYARQGGIMYMTFPVTGSDMSIVLTNDHLIR